MDLSLLGYDCSHFSERGCGSTAYHLQNCCAQTSVARSFFPVSTFSSSGYCIYNAAHDEEPSIYSTLITAIVLFFMCRKPRRTEDIKKTGESVWCEFQPHQIHR
ncbi:hypothetical protein Y032_0009g623 [Ancylostoma ceylanicum]|uniref:Uncharacterized protein n=1 Tax=Ancylostoma ceylanicum TaxID=53326 RepID=A0A016VJ04_9BILA|nr:hypothetical protein Y032_0009g623 [Ancylostoma ceylanicum]